MFPFLIRLINNYNETAQKWSLTLSILFGLIRFTALQDKVHKNLKWKFHIVPYVLLIKRDLDPAINHFEFLLFFSSFFISQKVHSSKYFILPLGFYSAWNKKKDTKTTCFLLGLVIYHRKEQLKKYFHILPFYNYFRKSTLSKNNSLTLSASGSEVKNSNVASTSNNSNEIEISLSATSSTLPLNSTTDETIIHVIFMGLLWFYNSKNLLKYLHVFPLYFKYWSRNDMSSISVDSKVSQIPKNDKTISVILLGLIVNVNNKNLEKYFHVLPLFVSFERYSNTLHNISSSSSVNNAASTIPISAYLKFFTVLFFFYHFKTNKFTFQCLPITYCIYYSCFATI